MNGRPAGQPARRAAARIRSATTRGGACGRRERDLRWAERAWERRRAAARASARAALARTALARAALARTALARAALARAALARGERGRRDPAAAAVVRRVGGAERPEPGRARRDADAHARVRRREDVGAVAGLSIQAATVDLGVASGPCPQARFSPTAQADRPSRR